MSVIDNLIQELTEEHEVLSQLIKENKNRDERMSLLTFELPYCCHE